MKYLLKDGKVVCSGNKRILCKSGVSLKRRAKLEYVRTIICDNAVKQINCPRDNKIQDKITDRLCKRKLLRRILG